MISGDGRTLTWTSFNKPKTVVSTSTNTRFDYGPERARIRQVRVQGAVTTTIKYAGTLFEQIGKTGAATEYVHYVFAGERRVAVYSKDTAPTPARVLRYLHQDHLGSVDTITDESGAVVERLSYDAWGKRRVGSGEDGWKDSAVAIAGASTPRGFTDHEHLDDFELVHMNGRVYEPLLGRFLSPDPLVQYPESTQGFNRYTYVSNNPLSLVDPTGYEDDEYDNWEDSTPDFDDGYGQDSGLGGPSTDGYEDGQADCPCHPGNAPLVSNPATGGSIPPTSGSPQGVNQAGAGAQEGGYIFGSFKEMLKKVGDFIETLFGGDANRPADFIKQHPTLLEGGPSVTFKGGTKTEAHPWSSTSGVYNFRYNVGYDLLTKDGERIPDGKTEFPNRTAHTGVNRGKPDLSFEADIPKDLRYDQNRIQWEFSFPSQENTNANRAKGNVNVFEVKDERGERKKREVR